MDKFDKFFRDDQNRIVIWQWPNLPLISWFVFMLAAAAVDTDYLNDGFIFLSSASLFTWAYLEIKQGSSYFRRTLGFIVLIIIAIANFSSL